MLRTKDDHLVVGARPALSWHGEAARAGRAVLVQATLLALEIDGLKTDVPLLHPGNPKGSPM